MHEDGAFREALCQLCGEDNFRAAGHPGDDGGHFLEAARLLFGRGGRPSMMAAWGERLPVISSWPCCRRD